MSAPGRTDVVLGSVPALGSLYATAVRRQAAGKLAAAKPGRGTAPEGLRLPAVRHVVRGVVPRKGSRHAGER